MTKKSDSKTLAILAHILGLFIGILGPLIIFLATDEGYAKKNARNALNWQISFLIYIVASAVLIFLVVGILFMGILSILDIVFCIIGAVKASEGELWEYPLTIKFLKPK